MEQCHEPVPKVLPDPGAEQVAAFKRHAECVLSCRRGHVRDSVIPWREYDQSLAGRLMRTRRTDGALVRRNGTRSCP